MNWIESRQGGYKNRYRHVRYLRFNNPGLTARGSQKGWKETKTRMVSNCPFRDMYGNRWKWRWHVCMICRKCANNHENYSGKLLKWNT